MSSYEHLECFYFLIPSIWIDVEGDWPFNERKCDLLGLPSVQSH